jgi:NADH-quinone oxidoreductase subunit F
MTLGEFDRSGRRRPEASDAKPFVISADQIIVATGQQVPQEMLERIAGDPVLAGTDLTVTGSGALQVHRQTGQTTVPWLFAGGDAVTGPASVVEAIAAGERAAVGMNLYLTGSADAFWRADTPVSAAFDPDADPSPDARAQYRTIDVDRRRNNFDEVEQCWCEAVALKQAGRCLRCDYGKPNREPVVPTKEELHA